MAMLVCLLAASAVSQGSTVALRRAHRSAVLASTTSDNRRVTVSDVLETAGGYMVRAEVANFNKQSKHTVVLSKATEADMRAAVGETSVGEAAFPGPARIVEAIFQHLMSTGVDVSNTEGMIDASVFPANYFTKKELDVFFPGAMDSVKQMLVDEARAAAA